MPLLLFCFSSKSPKFAPQNGLQWLGKPYRSCRMKISLNWLKTFTPLNLPTKDLENKLVDLGLEVEGVESYQDFKGGLKNFVIGEVLTCQRHPNADRLSLTTVDVGQENPLSIVCGAPNVAAGQKVVVALVGAEIYPPSGEPFQIKKGKIRGEVSEGMICAEDEIGLSGNHEGIIVLDTQLPNGTPAASFFGVFDDTIFEIGLTPNRVDAASHYGVARDLHAALQLPVELPSISAFKSLGQKATFKASILNAEACPRYACLLLEGLRVGESPKWLQNYLKAIGQKPINNVVDVTNYVLHSLGQPLHAFDAQKVSGKHLKIQTLPAGTKFRTLDDKERSLLATDLMICDEADKPLCMAGIFGGLESGVNAETTSVLLESAYFSPVFVRKSSNTHSLRTDASFRFSRGADPNMCLFALKYTALLIKEVAGGQIPSEPQDYYPSPIQNTDFDVKWLYLNQLIGYEIERAEVLRILERLEIKILENGTEHFRVSVPPYRVDMQNPADIVEEVLRVYGLNNIPLAPHLSTDFISLTAPVTHAHHTQMELRKLLAGMGFSEMYNNSLTSSKYSKALETSNNDVVILNKLSEDLDVMRQDLVFSGLETIDRNIKRREPNLKLFEIGTTYKKLATGAYEESLQLGIFITGLQQAESWLTDNTKNVVYQDLALAVQAILQKLNVSAVQQQKVSNTLLYKVGAVLSLKVQKDLVPVAELGLLKKSLTKLTDVEQEVFYASLNLSKLLKMASRKIAYTELSKYPAVRRDLSLVLPKNVAFEQVEQLALAQNRKLIRQINVFSVYEGERIDADKKSYAVSYLFQDDERTLDDKVIDKIMDNLIKTYENDLKAIIRR